MPPRRAVLLIPLLAGCEEIRRPAAVSLTPPELVGFSPDPLAAGASRAVALFTEEGRGLAGDPARAARAFALLEGLAADAGAAPRLADAPGAVRLLGQAVAETRRAAGLAPEVAPEEAIAAYLRAAAALGRGDAAAARAALAPPHFTPGGEGAVARLAAPGGLPVSAIATARFDAVLRGVAADRAETAAAAGDIVRGGLPLAP